MTDRRTLPGKCGVCGYYLTDDPEYAGYRCVCRKTVATLRAAALATGNKALLLAWADAEMARQLAKPGGDDESPF